MYLLVRVDDAERVSDIQQFIDWANKNKELQTEDEEPDSEYTLHIAWIGWK